jgi:hypothetical protein
MLTSAELKGGKQVPTIAITIPRTWIAPEGVKATMVADCRQLARRRGWYRTA